MLIGEACLQLKTTGNLDPTHPKHYNDVTIAAAARQAGATVITKNAKDLSIIFTTTICCVIRNFRTLEMLINLVHSRNLGVIFT